MSINENPIIQGEVIQYYNNNLTNQDSLGRRRVAIKLISFDKDIRMFKELTNNINCIILINIFRKSDNKPGVIYAYKDHSYNIDENNTIKLNIVYQ